MLVFTFTKVDTDLHPIVLNNKAALDEHEQSEGFSYWYNKFKLGRVTDRQLACMNLRPTPNHNYTRYF